MTPRPYWCPACGREWAAKGDVDDLTGEWRPRFMENVCPGCLKAGQPVTTKRKGKA